MAARRTGTNARTGSTTWDYRDAKLPGSRRGANQNVPKAPRWGGLSRRNSRDKITLTITYRGGNECWYLIEARGRSGVMSGVRALHDVMREINNDHRG